jgi:2-iminobutanoate/2-iminopropanoate deaminase
MEKVRISTQKAPMPSGWYSQAYKLGNMVYTAGVTAADPLTQEIVSPGNIEKQTEQVLKNLQEILVAAGTDLNHVIKTLVFVSDINKFNEFNEIYKKFFPVDPPVRSTVEVGNFLNGMEVEIEAIAVIE